MAMVRSNCYMSAMLMVFFLISSSISIVGQLRPWPEMLPRELIVSEFASKIRSDDSSVSAASTDFGMLTDIPPAAVLYPSSDHDIASMVQFSYFSTRSFPIAARGHGHSIWGQASAADGVVVEMSSLSGGRARIGVVVSESGDDTVVFPPYVDVGGGKLWVDVLHETLKYGLSPVSWTDYLHLTVGGTLSVAGVSGQAFRHGPQISNVLELDVITGKGEMVTCSEDHNSDLFNAVLGGLGQFGIITRARIPLGRAPRRAKWVRLIYKNFADFTKDQEYLISLGNGGNNKKKGFDYMEGSLFGGQSPVNSWRSSFFSGDDLGRINSLMVGADQTDQYNNTLYFIEGAMYYDQTSDVDQELKSLLEDLEYEPGFVFVNDVSYLSFLDRVHEGEMNMRSKNLWEVPHPWLNIFVPKSRIVDFDEGVFKGILRRQKSMGPILIFPLNKTKWDDRTSAVIPEGEEEEEIFYMVGMLRSAINGDWKQLDDQNQEILSFCEQEGLRVKQYMPHYKSRVDWMKHFGSKWKLFLERKRKYDPKAILSPGQGIFSLNFEDDFF